MNTQQAYLYFNIYLTRSVYFECSIIQIIWQQEKILIDIYEKPLLRKLGLSENFSHKMLYSRQSALRVGIVKLSTIIVIETLKQCIESI